MGLSDLRDLVATPGVNDVSYGDPGCCPCHLNGVDQLSSAAEMHEAREQVGVIWIAKN